MDPAFFTCIPTLWHDGMTHFLFIEKYDFLEKDLESLLIFVLF